MVSPLFRDRCFLSYGQANTYKALSDNSRATFIQLFYNVRGLIKELGLTLEPVFNLRVSLTLELWAYQVRNECRYAHPNVRSNVRTCWKRKPTPLRVGLSAPLSRSDLHGSENLGELCFKGWDFIKALFADGHGCFRVLFAFVSVVWEKVANGASGMTRLKSLTVEVIGKIVVCVVVHV